MDATMDKMLEIREAQRTNSPLEVSMEDYWFNTLRPFIEESLLTFKVDEELVRSLEKLRNTGDTNVNSGNPEPVKETVGIILNGITAKEYRRPNGPIAMATEDELKIVNELTDKLKIFATIVGYEKKRENETVVNRERLDYQAEEKAMGWNKDSLTRNMETLNQPNPKERIPNL